ncbi:MAG: pyruvate kinase [Simkaniaceae bacterium]|nr:pyruvate kinase [Simkaniaceae bacterium]
MGTSHNGQISPHLGDLLWPALKRSREVLKRTKIVCTMGPAVNSYEKITALVDAGMNVARCNMSHGTHEEHREMIALVKRVRSERGVPLAIMLDTGGPEVRTGSLPEEGFSLKKGELIRVGEGLPVGGEKRIDFVPSGMIDDIPLGATILFDDGKIMAEAVEKEKTGMVIKIMNDGCLVNRKSVNIPNADLNLPAVTEEDIEDIRFGCREGIDIVSASFIRSAGHVLEVKRVLSDQGSGDIPVIAKIENAAGVANFDAILQVSDGIMIGRGDLGVELPVTRVPKLQKMMIRKCYGSFKPAITATQMLESMIEHPRPTRAEISDVANAIYDSTSAVMLSGETAMGKYPVEAVRIMHETILETEEDCRYRESLQQGGNTLFHDVASSVSLAAVKSAYAGGGKGLVALTTGGFTARAMSRFRPDVPIIAVTPQKKTYHRLALAWGIVPVFAKVADLREGIAAASSFALENKILRYGDLIVVTYGSPFGISGTTNTMFVSYIGNVLVRGTPTPRGNGKASLISGKVSVLLRFPPDASSIIAQRIVVVPYFREDYAPYLQGALALIVQNHPADCLSEQAARTVATELDIPLLLRADAACTVLKEGSVVTFDPDNGLLFDGIMEH